MCGEFGGMMKRSKIIISWNEVLDTIILVLFLLSVLGFAGRFWWGLDLFSHYRVQYFQLCLIFTGVALWLRKNRRAGWIALLACFNYAFILPFYFGKPTPSQEPVARVMLLNLNEMGGSGEAVLKTIKTADPDLLVLEESTPAWRENLKELKSLFPHQASVPKEGCCGDLLLSKYPLENARIVNLGEAGLPTIVAEAYLPIGTVSIIATHPLPPIGAEYAHLHANQLAEVPALVHQQKYPVLLIGDLNTTPWSFSFSTLLRASGLKNSMKGFGFQPTWPAAFPLLQIPIDHVLCSPEITIRQRAVGGDLGSDHLPLSVDFSMP